MAPNTFRKPDMVFSDTLVKRKVFSSKFSILENSLTELTSKFMFCARSEKASLKFLAMQREQKDKLLISFRQIFNEGVFGLEKSSLVNEKYP